MKRKEAKSKNENKTAPIFSLSLVLQKLQAGKRGNEATTAETGSGSVIIPPAGNDERPFTDP